MMGIVTLTYKNSIRDYRSEVDKYVYPSKKCGNSGSILRATYDDKWESLCLYSVVGSLMPAKDKGRAIDLFDERETDAGRGCSADCGA
jgi:hypothetical protein